MLNVYLSFQYMQDFYNQTYYNRSGMPMTSDFQTLLWSLTVSMYPLGGFFGSLMVWPLVNNCGRYVPVVFKVLEQQFWGSDKACQAHQEHDSVTHLDCQADRLVVSCWAQQHGLCPTCRRSSVVSMWSRPYVGH